MTNARPRAVHQRPRIRPASVGSSSSSSLRAAVSHRWRRSHAVQSVRGPKAERSGELDPAFADGAMMGKRYVDETGAEVLVTKPGADSLQCRRHQAGAQGAQAAARQR
ncbi:hypothetical protein [Mycobacterium camsae]|uniref:hypothetical protein n=1 Tax=Mycobacterium gordonae TaxID=1778 RepID=UPI00197FFFC3|nr:hypothetical protein [Mycobacterium gordonae]